MFGTTKGLHLKYGRSRVFDTPLSEEGMMGVATGAAMNGAARGLGGDRSRMGIGGAAFASNSGTAPRCAWPENRDAEHTVRCEGAVVLVFEHRRLMKKEGLVPDGAYKVPLGKAAYRRRGTDLTVVGSSHAVELALQAANRIAEEGIETAVIDLRTIKPLDEALIGDSLAATGRRLVVDTGWAMGAGEAYNIGGTTTKTVGEFLEILKSKSTVPISSRVDGALLRPADVTLQISDTDKFTSETGWKPKYSFEESVDNLLAHWRDVVARGTYV